MAITQTITSIAPAANPATMDRATFSTTAAANVLAISNMTTELNTWAGQVNAIAGVAVGDMATGINAATAKTVPTGADKFVLTDSAAGNVLKSTTWANIMAVLPSEAGLTQYYYPSLDGNYRDLYRSGWLPAWFNQQWGGAQWGVLPDGSFGSVATGNVQDDNIRTFGNGAGSYNVSTSFKVSENITNPVVWIKLYRVGSPATAVLGIYSDTAGSPNALLGGTVAINPRIITSKPDGEWYAFSPTPGTLIAGTQYHIVLNEGATDAANYHVLKETTTRKYPHGFVNSGTSAPVWAQQTGECICFLIQNPAANSLLQSGGMFDYKLAFAAGTPANQSRSLAQPLSNFISGDDLTMLVRGTFVASTNVLDLVYGIDHDRITLTVDASGFPVLTIYRSNVTAATITGTVTCATGNHDIAFRVRLVGDGADYATLYDNGASVGTPLTAQTFTFAKEFFTLGTARLGDGFGLAPTWAQDMQMTSLPSAQGWTWSGTGTEANCMSVAGGKLYQNANGYASTQTGYYAKTVALNNTTGWCVEWKGRVPTSTNPASDHECAVGIYDGTKFVEIMIHEYFIQSYGVAVDFTVQDDFKSQEHTFVVQGKGSDYYVLVDGKLAIDGTGKLTTATATNAIQFGDLSATASVNADAIWSYVKYYQGGTILPTANNATCSEFAHWSGDKSALLPYLYNAGAPVSIKQLCGVPINYQYERVVQKEVRLGVTSAPTVASATDTLETDMECYVIGSRLDANAQVNITNGAAGNTMANNIYTDGSLLTAEAVTVSVPVAAYKCDVVAKSNRSLVVGLHKVEARTAASAGTNTMTLTARRITVEARS